jgi:hypothetical protein
VCHDGVDFDAQVLVKKRKRVIVCDKVSVDLFVYAQQEQ